ncbi:hypothetical protein [Chromobacterium vaccinii]|uniref:hypothetical protein n=1 Tax=Chromobacterium vaccinii TaxID=1108595 RepID=UPI0031D99EB6
MFLPVDPSKLNSLWDSLKVSLCEVEHSEIVSGGHFNPIAAQRLSRQDAESVVARMKELNYVRIGTGRMSPVPPHFGAHLDCEKSKASLMEYLGVDSSHDRIVRDISLLVDFVFFEIKSLVELTIPFRCEEVEVQGFAARYNSDQDCTIICRM